MKKPARRYTRPVNRHRKINMITATPHVAVTASAALPPFTAKVPLWQFPPVAAQPEASALIIKTGDVQIELTIAALQILGNFAKENWPWILIGGGLLIYACNQPRQRAGY
jgi:hypothetical protein